MRKLMFGALLVGLMGTAVVYGAPATEDAGANVDPGTDCPINFLGMGETDAINVVNEMPDVTRFEAAEAGCLPEAPFGYGYHEDLTLAPVNTMASVPVADTDYRVSEETRADMLAAGWYGVKGDRQELLYNPAFLTPGSAV